VDAGGALVVTGPNYSGKSVVLKTVALASVMAQCGSFVAAHAATLGVVDRVFTRVSSQESVVAAALQDESSFTLDVQQVVTMLRSCTRSSLLVLDEFGKGTCSFDGAALLAATLEHLVAGGCGPCPRVVASTHLVEIFDVLRRDFDDGAAPRIRVAEMRVEFDDRNPVPLFRLREGGVSRDSYGAACARRAARRARAGGWKSSRRGGAQRGVPAAGARSGRRPATRGGGGGRRPRLDCDQRRRARRAAH